jgi:hypothetical protein
MGLNLYQEETIFDDMETFRRYPKALFTASDESEKALLFAIERVKPGQ